MATFGYTSIGVSSGGGGSGVALTATSAVLATAGVINKVTAYLDSGAFGVNDVKCLIYSDNAGYPNALLATTNATSVTSATGAWYDFYFSTGVSLAVGTYWLTYIAHDGVEYFYDAGSTNQRYESLGSNYASPPSSFPGSAGGAARKLSIYATYVAQSAGFVRFNPSLDL